MVKNHLKRLAAPKTWGIKRKELVWITRPMPGAQSLDMERRTVPDTNGHVPMGSIFQEINDADITV